MAAQEEAADKCALPDDGMAGGTFPLDEDPWLKF
jgi:hypothetical protein